jgi:hypothetical protein
MTPKFDQLVNEMADTAAPTADATGVTSTSKWDKIQFGLDIAGIDPTVGTFADGANIGISTVRGLNAALKGEGDQVKRHAINAAISAVSLIPFADVVKVLKLRKLAKTGKAGNVVAKRAITGMKGIKKHAKLAKVGRASSERHGVTQPQPVDQPANATHQDVPKPRLNSSYSY